MAEAAEKHAERCEKIYAVASSRAHTKYKFDSSGGINGAQAGKAEILVNNVEKNLTVSFADKRTIQIPYSDIQGSDISVEGGEEPSNKKKEYLFHLNIHCSLENDDKIVVFSILQKPDPFTDPIGELNYLFNHLSDLSEKQAIADQKRQERDERFNQRHQERQERINELRAQRGIGPNVIDEAFKNGALMYLAGIDGNLELYKEKIVIDKRKSLEFQGLGRQEIFIKQITGVDVRPAYIAYGHIRIMMPGQIVSGFQDSVSAMRDPYTISFEAKENENVNAIKAKIEELLLSPAAAPTPVGSQMSAADELLKFKQLLDMGAITQEEFDTKKKHLLGL